MIGGLTYGDLPDEGAPNMCCVNDDCEYSWVPYSARRGDYFMYADDEPVTCQGCGEPMYRARESRGIELLP